MIQLIPTIQALTCSDNVLLRWWKKEGHHSSYTSQQSAREETRVIWTVLHHSQSARVWLTLRRGEYVWRWPEGVLLLRESQVDKPYCT